MPPTSRPLRTAAALAVGVTCGAAVVVAGATSSSASAPPCPGTTHLTGSPAGGARSPGAASCSLRTPSVTLDKGVDTVRTAYDTPVVLDLAEHDTTGDIGLGAGPDAASARFRPGDNPDAWVVGGGGSTIAVPGEGEYAVRADGTGSFTPQTGFVGQTSTVTYAVRGSDAASRTARLSVVVRPGPHAVPDSAATPQGVDVTLAPLAGDGPGLRADGTGGGWDVASLALRATPDLPAGSEVSPDGTVLTAPGEGVYTVAPGGSVTFDPEPSFRGTASAVGYVVSDGLGNPASSTISVTVSAIDPVASADTAATPIDTPVLLTGATDDLAGADTAPLVPGATVFPAPARPAGAVVSADGTTVTVPEQGRYEVQPDGAVLFTPVPGYAGTTTAVGYRVEDTNGTPAWADLRVVVRDGSAAAPDNARTPQNVDATLTPLGNDSPGPTASGRLDGFDVASLVFTTGDQPAGATVSADGTGLTVPGEGVWTISADGVVTFDPGPAFSGTASPATYRVADPLGGTASSTITVVVEPDLPSAAADRVRTPYETAVMIDVLPNDVAGRHSSLDPATLRLVHPRTGMPVQQVVRRDGAWMVRDGVVGFVPGDGFSGSVQPLGYVVSDSNGSETTARIRVVVGGSGTSAPSEGATTPGGAVTVDVLDHVTAAPGEELLEGTACLVPGAASVTAAGRDHAVTGAAERDDACSTEYALEGIGAWTVEPDGSITVTPQDGFVGAAAIDFTVEDTGGTVYQDSLTVTVRSGDPVPRERVTGRVASGLPSDGGPAPGWLGLGLAALLGGLALTPAGRRRLVPRRRR